MRLDDAALDQLFRNARTHNAWLDRPVPDSLLVELHDLMKWGPTSANCWPLRVVFVKSPDAKARLIPLLMEGNRAKTQAAPVTAILGMDMAFYEQLPRLFPHTDARAWFVGNDALIEATAFRNSSLQGADFILVAPLTPWSAYLFAMVIGLLWLATVPLTPHRRPRATPVDGTQASAVGCQGVPR